jgi:hypothetical protein
MLAKDFGGGQACRAGPYDGDVFQEEERFLCRSGGEAYHVLEWRMDSKDPPPPVDGDRRHE